MFFDFSDLLYLNFLKVTVEEGKRDKERECRGRNSRERGNLFPLSLVVLPLQLGASPLNGV